MSDRVVIVGAGIGGLSVALGLMRRGVDVSVHEKATELREIGAGIVLQPNGRRALVDLGVDERIAAAAGSVSTMRMCDYATGDEISSTPTAAIRERYGYATLSVHRADLHSALLDAVRGMNSDCVHVGHEFASLEQDRDGVTVRFVNGDTARGVAAIGADGNGSAVRSFLFPGVPASFNGQVAYRALVPGDQCASIVHDREIALYRGPGRYFLHYPLRSGGLMNLIGVGRTDTWEAEGWSTPATRDEFANAYSDFAPYLVDLIHAIPDDELFKWGLYDRPPLERWRLGRVAILGDAAHPMTPFLGQGASMAIEDAVVFARAYVAGGGVEDSLASFDATRRERGNNVAGWSLEEGQALQDPLLPYKGAAGYGLLDFDAATEPLIASQAS